MGKKNKRIYQQIYDFNNLFRASRLARLGKRNRPDVCEFEYDLEHRLLDIQLCLKEQTYRFSPYKSFLLKDPKERLIYSAPYPDRVLHHAISNVIEPIFDKAMIFDSYACRTGKGSHRAVNRAQTFLRQSKWVLKLDIRKYFATIDHTILIQLIKDKIKDDIVVKLLELLISSHHSGIEYYFPFKNDTIDDILRNRGLPIGNLTSQIFANYYLTPFDRFIKEKLKVKYYLRYMDDCLIFDDDKRTLTMLKNSAIYFLESYRLKLHDEKSQVFPCENGVKFLGFHIWPDRMRILRENLKRFKKRWRNYQKDYFEGKIEFNRLKLSLNGWLGYSANQYTTNLINEILDGYKFKTSASKDSGFTFCLPLGRVAEN